MRLSENVIDNINYSNREDYQSYPSSNYICDNCGEKIGFSLKDLDKHRFLNFSNLNLKDQKIMNKLILSMIPKSKLNEPFQSFGIWYFLPIILINPTNHFQYILPLIGYQ